MSITSSCQWVAGDPHEDFTVQQLETGVNCLDQPGQVCRREATGRRRWQQDHLPVDRPLGWQRFNGGHVNRVHPRLRTGCEPNHASPTM
jgi:hypothetical protein